MLRLRVIGVTLLLWTAASAPALAGGAALTFEGLTPVSIGMTVAEAEAALQARLAPLQDRDAAGCWTTSLADGSDPSVVYMVESGRITRIDVWQPPDAQPPATRTASGIGVGSLEAEITAAYGTALAVKPHPYLGDQGRVLMVEDKVRGTAILFETDEQHRVLTFRAGRHPAVDYIEGCS
jgi:hypothetical protein